MLFEVSRLPSSSILELKNFRNSESLSNPNAPIKFQHIPTSVWEEKWFEEIQDSRHGGMVAILDIGMEQF